MSIPGKLLYHLWHRPIYNLWLDGGLRQRRLAKVGHQEMREAAHKLGTIEGDEGPPVSLHLLTGNGFWHQTAFCLVSFARASHRKITPIIFDDGSLTKEQCETLFRIAPNSQIITAEETQDSLAHFLPAGRYPSLRKQQVEHPMFKKLINIHIGRSGWRLQVDSDLLFFRPPVFLLSWHDRPTRPLHARDFQNSYGCSLSYLNRMAGKPVPERLNAGLLGLKSDDIDWDKMEFWAKKLADHGGNPHFREQALVALHLAGLQCDTPPPDDYVLMPEPPEALECRAVMHHYVAHSKRWYFQTNWRRFTKSNAS